MDSTITCGRKTGQQKGVWETYNTPTTQKRFVISICNEQDKWEQKKKNAFEFFRSLCLVLLTSILITILLCKKILNSSLSLFVFEVVFFIKSSCFVQTSGKKITEVYATGTCNEV